MRAIVALCLLSGCIHPDLVPCGDNACPDDKICNAGACIFAGQLTACEALPDATPCAYTGTSAAVCVGGICQPLGCGNGILTPDEVCDDGNNVNGDGCSADCKSNETCGNGIVDFATGEQCDDGNQDNLDGCRNDCTLPRCGDGIVDPSEQCDSAATGALASTCIDLGYDLGALTCSSECEFDVKDSCERFGWQLVTPTYSFPTALAGDGDTIAYPGSGSTLQISIAGVWSAHTGAAPYVAVDVRAGTIVAASSSGVDLESNGVWTTLPVPPIPSGTAIIAASLASEDSTPIVLASGNGACAVEIYTLGAWTSAAEPSTCTALYAFAANDYAVITSTPTIEWTWATGSRSWSPQGPVVGVVRGTNELRAAELLASSVIEEGVPMSGAGANEFQLLAQGFLSGHVAVTDALTAYAVTSNDLDRFAYYGTHTHQETFATPPNLTAAPRLIFTTHDGVPYVAVGAELYRLGALASTQRVAPADSALIAQVRLGYAAGDDSSIVCGAGLWASSAQGWTELSSASNGTCSALYAITRSNLYAARSPGGVAGLYLWNGGGWIEQLLTPGNTSMQANVIAGSTGALVALLSNGTIVQETAATWTALDPLPAGCAASSVTASGTTVIAGGVCNGVGAIWQLSGTSWTDIHDEPRLGAIVALYLASDGTIVAADNHGDIIGSGATWQYFSGVFGALSGTSSSDVFALVSTTGPLIELWHWDGARWGPIAIDATYWYYQIAVGPTGVLAIAAPFPAPEPVTWLGFERGR